MKSKAWIAGLSFLALAGCSVDEPSSSIPGGDTPGGKADGVGGPIRCWTAANANVDFNSDLDPVLEVPVDVLGLAPDRQQAFQDAVDAWNAELAAIGASFALVANLGAASFASSQGVLECNEANGINVHRPDYAVFNQPSRGHGNVINTASTEYIAGAMPGYAANPDRNAMGGPGAPGGYEPDEPYSPGQGTSPDRLAETAINAPILDAAGNTLPDITEADITWMTHLPTACGQIPWAYDHGQLDANHYDFYSVMLHELGHFLGLEHELDPQNANNVMSPTVRMGQTTEIAGVELAQLTARYAPGGTCNVGGNGNPVDPPQETPSCGNENEDCCADATCNDGLTCDPDFGFCYVAE